MKVFITEQCVQAIEPTFQIEVHEVEQTPEDVERGMVRLFLPKFGGWMAWKKPDWHLTYEEAQARALEMQREKIAELESDLESIRKLTF